MLFYSTYDPPDLAPVRRRAIMWAMGNIYKTKELERVSTCAKNAQVSKDGKIRQMDTYNLDMIISVGYRVNSKRGTQFRIWATNILSDHMIKGYSVNQNRLRDFNQAVRLIADTAQRHDLSGDEAKALLRVVEEYRRALSLLDDYDHQRVSHTSAVAAGKRWARQRLVLVA